jgi:hypothetical protein
MEVLMARLVPDVVIRTERMSSTITENIVCSMRMLSDSELLTDGSHFVIVADAYMAPRARAIFAELIHLEFLPSFGVDVVEVPKEVFNAPLWVRSLEAVLVSNVGADVVQALRACETMH